eukprot:6363662-Pyramimonas_sp.AAC.1
MHTSLREDLLRLTFLFWPPQGRIPTTLHREGQYPAQFNQPGPCQGPTMGWTPTPGGGEVILDKLGACWT